MKKFFKKTDGFTLVELIVVIAILGILAGVGTVGYSGYIKKAQAAADNQLLAAVNQAYAAACIENGLDSKQVTAKSITVGSDKTVDKSDIVVTNSAKAADIQAAFEKYFKGNEGSEFKVFATLTYDKNAGGFKHSVLSDAYAALLDTFDDDDIKALNDSTFGDMGVTDLLGSVDLASNVATELMNADDPDDRIVALVNSDASWNNLVKALGFTSDADEGFDAAYDALMEKKVAQMKADAKYAGKTDAELADMAYNALMTNSAVFTVATSSTLDEANAFAAKLADGTAKQTIKDNLAAGGDLEEGLSQAALTYALYTAYAEKNGIAMSQDTALDSVLDALGDENFKAYAANASADVAGYQAAMNMVQDSFGNTDAATDLLLNGFNNDDLMVLLQSTIG